MQLDRTHVVVRARSIGEIADLAMVLIRAYPKSVILAFIAGAMPWFLINALLLGHLVIAEFEESLYQFGDENDMRLSLYQSAMLILVFLQTPIAGALTTVSLGRSVFETQPTLRAAWEDARSHFWRWFWVLAVVRGPMPAMVLVAMFAYGQNYGGGLFVLFLTSIIYALLRSFRPFMPEILLLERCPLRAKGNKDQLTVSGRVLALHRPLAGDCFGRFVTMSLVAVVIATSVFCSIMWVRGVMFNLWDWDRGVYLVFYPLSLWVAAGFTVVVRFLSYLDARIRLEGWEVQLAVMAEAIRQFGETSPSPAHSVGNPPALASVQKAAP